MSFTVGPIDSSEIVSCENKFLNTTVNLGPMTVMPGGSFMYSDESDEISEKCRRIISSIGFSPLTEVSKQLKKFDGVYFGNVQASLRYVRNENNELLTIMVFINGKFLDLRKLPLAPLKFIDDTVNGLPIDQFIIKV